MQRRPAHELGDLPWCLRGFTDRAGRDPRRGASGRKRHRYWAACEAAEATRILETHRRKAGLTSEGLEALGRYGRRAQLMLLEHFPYLLLAAAAVVLIPRLI